MNYKILVVDDEPANLRLLERLFRREYQVFCAASGDEALELLKLHDFALIVSDQRMPRMTGIEFLKRAAAMRPHTVRIILTGYTDVNALVEVINSGVVYKYVTKPWVNEDLQQTVVRAIEHYETIKSRYELTLQNRRLTEQVDRMKQTFVRLIGDTIDFKDSFLHRHLQRTSGYAVAVGYRLGFNASELERLSLAAFLHDVGQIGIPDNIRHRTSILTDEEYQTVEHCAERGAQMLASIPDMNEIAVAVRHHTEHFDGTGLPEKFSAAQIPLFSLIIAVADAYDEMTEPLDQSTALNHTTAIEKLRSGVGRQFDASVVEAFCEIESINKIRLTIAEGFVVLQLSPARISCDENSMSTGEVLHKFKTEPLLALQILKTGNLAVEGGSPTAQLLPLMSKIGERKLRSLLEQYGLPSADEFAKVRTARALRRAVSARMLAAQTGVIHQDDAYTLGLVYNIGETLLFNLFPEKMLELEDSDHKVRGQRQVEIFGIDAAQISRWMLEDCGVPKTLTAAIENQPDFMRVSNPVALLMQIACRISETEPAHKTAALNAIESSSLEILNLSRFDLNEIYERANFINEECPEVSEYARELIY
jgi:response regulator RpfG family c-di-GMP phosphodiesterase